MNTGKWSRWLRALFYIVNRLSLVLVVLSACALGACRTGTRYVVLPTIEGLRAELSNSSWVPEHLKEPVPVPAEEAAAVDGAPAEGESEVAQPDTEGELDDDTASPESDAGEVEAEGDETTEETPTESDAAEGEDNPDEVATDAVGENEESQSEKPQPKRKYGELRPLIPEGSHQLVELVDLRSLNGTDAVAESEEEPSESTESTEDEAEAPTDDEDNPEESETVVPQQESPAAQKRPVFILAPGDLQPHHTTFYSLGYVLKHGRMALCLVSMARSWHRRNLEEPDIREGNAGWIYRYDVLRCSESEVTLQSVGPGWSGCDTLENTLREMERTHRIRLTEFVGGNVIHFLRSMFPLYFSGFNVGAEAASVWPEVEERLADVAYEQVRSARDLVYGDVLIDRSVDSAGVAIYQGHGLVAAFRSGEVVYETLGQHYDAAYRVIPGFALCGYRTHGGDFLRGVVLSSGR